MANGKVTKAGKQLMAEILAVGVVACKGRQSATRQACLDRLEAAGCVARANDVSSAYARICSAQAKSHGYVVTDAGRAHLAA